MRLSFSKDSPINATISDENGQILYILKTPRNIGSRTTTVYHACALRSENNGWNEPGQPMMMKIGEVVHHPFSPSTLRFGRMPTVSSKAFFRKDPSWFKSKRYWKAEDGREYVWNYGSKHTKLSVTDAESDGLVAEYHNPWLSGIRDRPVYLKVTPLGEHMLDWIILTFVYIQKLREEEED